MNPKPPTNRAQHPIERVQKLRELFKHKSATETKKFPTGSMKPILRHSALSRVKNMETEWKKVVIVKTDVKNTVDVRVLAASFDNMKV